METMHTPAAQPDPEALAAARGKRGGKKPEGAVEPVSVVLDEPLEILEVTWENTTFKVEVR